MRFCRRAVISFVRALTIASTFALSGCSGSGGPGNVGPSIPSRAGPASSARSFGSAANAASGQPGTYKRLYSFGASPDGSYPAAKLTSADGVLYGTTSFGGASGHGTVFEITSAGAESVLYSFKDGSDGSVPIAGLIDVGGALYGTTSGGGTGKCGERGDGCGTVFSVTPGRQERVVYSFEGGSDGSEPFAGLIDVRGTLYGTTTGGGTGGGCGGAYCGTVFSVTTAGQESVVYSFAGGAGGFDPVAGLRMVDGKLYGVDEIGGSDGCGVGCGTVFEVTTAGQERTLYEFKGHADGAVPDASLTDVDGTLYGTTSDGGIGRKSCGYGGCGTVFKITTSGKKTTVYKFKGGSDGARPVGLIVVNGALYGTTVTGGKGCGNYQGCGTVFKFTTSGEESVLYSFKGGFDGEHPLAPLEFLDGKLYGTTSAGGGANHAGTVFSIQL